MNAKSKIRPLFDNVLIKPVKGEEKTVGGIILPDTVKEKPQVGEVLTAGKGHIDSKGNVRPMSVKSGDKVMYKKWGGNEVKVNGEDCVIVEEKDILAIIE